MIEVDGAHGEGGGQLVRNAVALSAITGRPVRVRNVRAGRAKPGLAAQHVTAVRAVGALCDAIASGLELRSTELAFSPRGRRGGEFCFDVGTAGSTMLVLQAVMPVAVAFGVSCRFTITGGSDVRAAPTADYLQGVLLPLLAQLGVRASASVPRHGYYPGGGAQVVAEVHPGTLRPLRLERARAPATIVGRAHVAGLPRDIADRMRASAHQALAGLGAPIALDSMVLADEAACGHGGALAAWVKAEDRFIGACRVAERGVRAETLGKEVGDEIVADLKAGVTLDVHAADQVLIYLALARDESSFTTRELTAHARTAMWLIEQFLPVRFEATRITDAFHVLARRTA